MVFQGLIHNLGNSSYSNNILTVISDNFFSDSQPGDSISVNGVCLTIKSCTESQATFDLLPSTLKLTNLGETQKVNLEKALVYNDKVSGDFIQGHVWGQAKILTLTEDENESWLLMLDVTDIDQAPLIQLRDSISVDGICLTVASIRWNKEKIYISCYLTPTTYQKTNIQFREPHDKVNLELAQLKFGSHDDDWMKVAMVIGEQGRITAPPNPWVGAILIQDNEILGQGYHRGPGHPHAEVVAINDAHQRGYHDLSKSTLYVTLEPCPHTGKTPPCTDAIIEAGIKKVLVGIPDPDVRVRGLGLRKLKEANINVECPLLPEQLAKSLEPYLYSRQLFRPLITLKTAVDWSGSMGSPNKRIQLTSYESQVEVARMRALSQAVLVGGKTIRIDNPKLTPRLLAEDKEKPLTLKANPLRVVVTKGLEDFNPDSHIFDTELTKTLIITSKESKHIDKWLTRGVEIVTLTLNSQNEFSWSDIWTELHARGVLSVLVEAGPQMIQSLLKEGYPDKWVYYLTPGKSMTNPLNISPNELIDDKWTVTDIKCLERRDVRIEYKRITDNGSNSSTL